MRPVIKGNNTKKFEPYTDAQAPLITTIGEHCSYCGRWIASGIHVEHKQPKLNYPLLKFSWSNFLLSCSNCNSTKSSGLLNLDDYIWPDTDNTLLGFDYDSEGRVIPKSHADPDICIKISNTWIMLGLNKHPDTTTLGYVEPTKKDMRWLHRKQEWLKAQRALNRLRVNDTDQIREMIVDTAMNGIFSIWFSVFYDDVDMKKRLVDLFIGTDSSCFDADFNPINRVGGII